ncbi:hypothetical protein DFH09DRAFT_1468146 [Mycena vulgaris]|nr:hypothetical protein DFH09DRAFT_1468146 [Mycena vulgaris]
MQPCLEAQFGKILGSWLDLDSTESADLEQLPKEGGTGVEVATATSELKTLFTETRGSSEEEDETKLKEDSYIRLERKERANAALIRNMVAPATETQRPGGIFFLHQSFGGPPTPLEFSCAFYILRRRHTNRAFHGKNLHPYNPTQSILRLCWGWILVKVFSLSISSLRCSRAIFVSDTELGDFSWGLNRMLIEWKILPPKLVGSAAKRATIVIYCHPHAQKRPDETQERNLKHVSSHPESGSPGKRPPNADAPAKHPHIPLFSNQQRDARLAHLVAQRSQHQSSSCLPFHSSPFLSSLVSLCRTLTPPSPASPPAPAPSPPSLPSTPLKTRFLCGKNASAGLAIRWTISYTAPQEKRALERERAEEGVLIPHECPLPRRDAAPRRLPLALRAHPAASHRARTAHSVGASLALSTPRSYEALGRQRTLSCLLAPAVPRAHAVVRLLYLRAPSAPTTAARRGALAHLHLYAPPTRSPASLWAGGTPQSQPQAQRLRGCRAQGGRSRPSSRLCCCAAHARLKMAMGGALKIYISEVTAIHPNRDIHIRVGESERLKEENTAKHVRNRLVKSIRADLIRECMGWMALRSIGSNSTVEKEQVSQCDGFGIPVVWGVEGEGCDLDRCSEVRSVRRIQVNTYWFGVGVKTGRGTAWCMRGGDSDSAGKEG